MKLIFHTFENGVQEFEVNQTSIVVGRGSNCDVILKVEGLSRQHCRIELDQYGNFKITDLNSTNGVLIDNQRIPPNTPTPYSVYLPLTIGSIPQVTLEPPEMELVAVELETPVQPDKIELDQRRHKKKITTRRRKPVPQVEVRRSSPWKMLMGILLLTYITLSFLNFI